MAPTACYYYLLVMSVHSFEIKLTAMHLSCHACFLFRVQIDWSPDNSVEDLLAYLQQKVCIINKLTNSYILILPD